MAAQLAEPHASFLPPSISQTKPTAHGRGLGRIRRWPFEKRRPMKCCLGMAQIGHSLLGFFFLFRASFAVDMLRSMLQNSKDRRSGNSSTTHSHFSITTATSTGYLIDDDNNKGRSANLVLQTAKWMAVLHADGKGAPDHPL